MSGKVHLENITCIEYETQLSSGQPLLSAEFLFSSSVQATTAAKCQPTGRAVFHVRLHTEQIAKFTHLLPRTELSPFVSMEE